MSFENLLKILVEKFNEAGIRVALIGGLALHVVGLQSELQAILARVNHA